MRPLLPLALSLLLAACGPKMADLRQPAQASHFEIAQDHAVITTCSIYKIRCLYVLKAGRYVAAGEDDDGTYYMGTAPAVFFVDDKDEATYAAYVRTGHVRDVTADGKPLPVRNGGLIIPHPGSDKEPQLFWPLQNNHTAVPVGVTLNAINDITDGEIQYIPFGKERAFVDGLLIHND